MATCAQTLALASHQPHMRQAPTLQACGDDKLRSSAQSSKAVVFASAGTNKQSYYDYYSPVLCPGDHVGRGLYDDSCSQERPGR